MIFNENDLELAAAFAVVRQYDPGTYARMQATKWRISNDPFDLSLDFALSLMSSPHEMLSEAVTLPDTVPGSDGWALTWIGIETLRQGAVQFGVTLNMHMAAILVHEFKHVHVHGHNEQEAFAAGSAFASRLPAPDGPKLRTLSEDSARFEREHPVAYNPGAYGVPG